LQGAAKAEITAVKSWPYVGLAREPGKPTELVVGGMPTIIDLNAEAEKLTMFRGLTPQTTRAERKGSAAQLPRYRDGLLLLGKSAGTGHWETHPEDELVHVLDGAATLDIVQKDGPQSFALSAGMIAIVPQSAWHRFHSADGRTTMSATIPGDHIDLDVDDPRTSTPDLDLGDTTRPPSIIDLNAELAKLTIFRGRTPRSTMADREGSSARLASYRDGILSITKFAGKGHWESHLAGDELIHILDGTATLEMLGEDGPQSFALHAGMVAINPQGAWHRFSSADGVTLLAVTPSPSEVIDLDVDDPRQVERKPA
jgi:quercetin dioxygenase-like cupin family protein